MLTRSRTHPSPLGVFINQKEAEVVDDFTYHNSCINSNGKLDKELLH